MTSTTNNVDVEVKYEDRYLLGLEGYCICGRHARRGAKYDQVEQQIYCSRCFAKESKKHKPKCFICKKTPTKLYDLCNKTMCCACYKKHSRPKHFAAFQELINQPEIISECVNSPEVVEDSQSE